MRTTNDIAEPMAQQAATGAPGPMPPKGRPPGADHGIRAALTSLLWGLQRNIPDGALVRIDGADRQKAEAAAQMQSILAQFATVDQLAAELAAERSKLRQLLPSARELRVTLKAAMVTHFGRSSPTLDEFGIRVHGARKLTVDEKALKAEKARRTRILRGTMGKRQKATIRYTGDPTLVLGPNRKER
jgi:hypothetical protein